MFRDIDDSLEFNSCGDLVPSKLLNDTRTIRSSFEGLPSPDARDFTRVSCRFDVVLRCIACTSVTRTRLFFLADAACAPRLRLRQICPYIT